MAVIFLSFDSFVVAFKDTALNNFYEKERAVSKDLLNVMRHVCHKLLSIIVYVMRDNKPYDRVQILSRLFIAGLFRYFNISLQEPQFVSIKDNIFHKKYG